MANSGVTRLKQSRKTKPEAIASKVMNNGTITDKGGQKSVKPSGKSGGLNE